MIESKLAALLWTLWIIYWRQTLSNRAEKIYEQVRCFVPSLPHLFKCLSSKRLTAA